MAVKALIAVALVVAIAVGVLLPIPHGPSQAEARSTTFATLDIG